MTTDFIKIDPKGIALSKHTFRFNVEGGDHLDLVLTKDQFEKLSEFCEKEFPDKQWKTKTLKAVEV